MAENLSLEQQFELLQEKVTAHAEKISQLEQVNVQQMQIIADQAKQLETYSKATTNIDKAKPKKLPIPETPVSIDGEEYLFQVAAFRLPGETDIILSEDAALRPEMLKAVLKLEGQGILKKLV